MALNHGPRSSIDRAHGNQFSPDPLGAHPLASSLPSDASTVSQSILTPPRYVPYTPRQRPVATTASTTPNSSNAITSSPSNGEATSKLQLQRLKAAVQTFGVESDSIGWAILEKIFTGANEGVEWDDIWNAIASGSVGPYDAQTLLWDQALTSSAFEGHFSFTDRAVFEWHASKS